MSDLGLSSQVQIDDEKPLKEGEYKAEKIFEMRTIYGRTEFLVQWKDYPSQRCTWAQEEDLNCPGLVEEFFESQRIIIMDASMGEQAESFHSGEKPAAATLKKRPSRLRSGKKGDLGYETMSQKQVKKVIGVHKDLDGMVFEIKFKNGHVFLVPKAYAYDKFLDAILEYYESTIDWESISVKNGV